MKLNLFRYLFPVLCSFAIFHSVALPTPSYATDRFDIVIYSATPAGIMAAVQATRQGASVVILESKTVIGGMITAGLGATDIGSAGYIGGLSREFFGRVSKAYNVPLRWNVEASVAVSIFKSLLEENKIAVRKGWEIARVERNGKRITGVRSATGALVQGKVFIDASYEGDLLALAGISHRIGREPSSEYGEPLAGVYPRSRDLFDMAISPYDNSGQLLPGISTEPLGEPGSGDDRLPAYNYRICLTQAAENRIGFAAPANYDARRYEILARYLEKRQITKLNELFNILDLPSKKNDLNNKGPISSNLIGGSTGYPNASFAERKKIDADHESYLRGILWFLQSDPRVPQVLREETSTWGYCRDEFTETGNWPHQIYIREARRMVGEYVLTQKDVQVERVKPDAIGVASKPIESHHVRRYITREGTLQNEGFVYTRDDGNIPYDIPYRALLPKQKECENLLVPVCVSSTHIAFSSLRMEPVYMILGMSSGAAAALAAKKDGAVHNVPYKDLKSILESGKQILTWVEDDDRRTKARE